MSKSYSQLLTEAYEDEVGGRYWFNAFKTFYTQADQAEKLTALVELEKQTATALKDLIDQHQLPTKAVSVLEQAAIDDAKRLSTKTWVELMTFFAQDFPKYLAEFQQCLDLAPIDEKPILEQVLNHEIALIEFVKRELAQHPESLTPIAAHIERYN